jgi:hypothetical protein
LFLFFMCFFLIPNRCALGTLRKYQKSSAIDVFARSEKAMEIQVKRQGLLPLVFSTARLTGSAVRPAISPAFEGGAALPDFLWLFHSRPHRPADRAGSRTPPGEVLGMRV